jgi:hypothetical protein
MPHKSKILDKPSYLEYFRKPTKEEVKFGYGALHYRDFEFEKCFDENGNQKLKAKALDDGLIYYYTGLDYYNKLRFQTIEI